MTDNKLKPEEVDELRKSLAYLGFTEEEINEQIEKAVKTEEKEESQHRVEDMVKKDEEKEIKKSESWKKIEKAIEEHEAKYGKKEVSKNEEIKKSIEDVISELKPFDNSDFEKSINSSIEKSIGSLVDIFEKSLNSKMDGVTELVKSIQSEVKKIGDAPIPMKSNFNGKVNFFEKSLASEEANENKKVLSISRNRDELVNDMQDFIEKSVDGDLKKVVSDGLVEFVTNRETTTPNAVKALMAISKQRNITLTQ